MQIDPSLRGKLPPVAEPTPFAGTDGRPTGWKVTLPGGRPLATPAVVDGRVFVGGGFGSYEFYALDAATGRLAWQYQTTDDGPTAAAVLDDRVVFNTESCELEVLTTDGQPVWKRWLGDPLMSMPAVAPGRVFIVFPESRGDRQHYLACFGLSDGTELWRTQLAGEIITAPVLADERVYLTTLDGTLACFRQDNGARLWHEAKNATSSPQIWKEQCYFSQRHEVSMAVAGHSTQRQTEGLSRRGSAADSATKAYAGTARAADYLDHARRAAKSPHYRKQTLDDAAVGFSGHKGDAKVHQAMHNLGHAHVSSLWAYQGSKPFLTRGRLFSALGDTLHCVDPGTEEVAWKKTLHADRQDGELLDSPMTPPAVVNGKLFVGTILGEVYCVRADSGDVLWRIEVGEPIVFQPAVARGCVYAASGAGSLFCLPTGDAADDAWLMWGATAAHNGLPSDLA
jgi:outer membrane protein assembly factor BamB